MNLLHLKYAVEVDKTRSINQAAQNLYMGQPNLSRAIKELESNLGITIFKRTSKGIAPTPEGEEFLQYAKKILHQVDQVEAMYKAGRKEKQKFSISVPRANYIGDAFTEFAKRLNPSVPAEIFYKETNSMRAITNILQADYKLGIIRYQVTFEQYFSAMLREKDLASETICEFSYQLLMSQTHPLAEKEEISLADLGDYIEIAHADPYVPSLPLIDVKKAELSEYVDKRIYVFERGSQFDLLANVPGTFMWISPVHPRLLSQYGLVQRKCAANKKRYRDVLIYSKGYVLTALDRMFIEELNKAKQIVEQGG